MNEQNENYEVTFYFSSGETLIACYPKDKLEEMYKTIKKAWRSCCMANDEWGLNFAQVTHYKVKILD